MIIDEVQAGVGRTGKSFWAFEQHGLIPDNLDTLIVGSAEKSLGIAQVLREVGLVASSSEGYRMVKQGAVRRNGEHITDPKLALLVDGKEAVFQVGKRKFAKVILQAKLEDVAKK